MPRNLQYLDKILAFKTFVKCKSCYSNCYGSDRIKCNVCCEWYHRKCKRKKCLMTKATYVEYTDKNCKKVFICSDQCYNTFLPFHDFDNIGVVDLFFGVGQNPCRKCKRDCVKKFQHCKKCMKCDKWIHKSCIDDGIDFNADHFLCSLKCEMAVLPFSNSVLQELLDQNIISGCKSVLDDDVLRSMRYLFDKDHAPDDHPDISPDPNAFLGVDHFLNINCSYLNPNKLNNAFFSNTASELTVFHNNIRSLTKNFDSVKNEIFHNCSEFPDVLAFTETKLNEGKNIPELQGYNFESLDSLTSCGGVGMYISEKLNYTLRPDLSIKSEHSEDLWIDVVTENQKNKSDKPSGKVTKTKNKFVVGAIYRHPKQNYTAFCKNLCRTLAILNKTKTEFIIVGDFNINILKYNLATNVSHYVNCISSLGCHFFIDKPTRISPNSATCIDHVYSNKPSEHLENYIITSDASDHFATLTKIHRVDKDYYDDPDIFVRKNKLSSEEWALFNEDLNFILNQRANIIDSQIIDVNH